MSMAAGETDGVMYCRDGGTVPAADETDSSTERENDWSWSWRPFKGDAETDGGRALIQS